MKNTMLIAVAFLAGCSSVEVISQGDSIASSSCQVKVYQTQLQALKGGLIEELCIISGTSSGSFDHTISTAIEKHKNKACACGASNVYIESRTHTGLDVAAVTMVAFRYVVKN
jgi:hypothetical protein